MYEIWQCINIAIILIIILVNHFHSYDKMEIRFIIREELNEVVLYS